MLRSDSTWVRKVLLAAAVGLVVVAAGFALLPQVWTAGDPDRAAPLGPDAARSLAEQLRSGDPDEVGEVVAMPPGQLVPPEFVEGLRELRELNFDPTSFRDHGDGTAQIAATVRTGLPQMMGTRSRETER